MHTQNPAARRRLNSFGAAVLGLLLAGTAARAQTAKAPIWLKGYRARWLLRVVGDPAKQKAATVIARLPNGGWLKPDASDLAVCAADGKTLPVTVLSHDPLGATIVQFKRRGSDRHYWAYGGNAKPLPQAKIIPAPKEGLTLEVRAWAGTSLESWAKVREGLQKSSNVIGNAVVAQVVQNSNPARPDRPRKFAASYRGFLDVKRAGVYRFFLNCDDAAFLFIDGFKVLERPGSNRPLAGKIKLKEVTRRVELKAGVHPLEVYHVVGDNPYAFGLCALMWELPPGKGIERGLRFVPLPAFVPALSAQVVAVEERGGTLAPAFAFGMDDSLRSAGQKLFLVRFEAQGPCKDADKLVWDFGDGSTGKGVSPTHVYFKGGTYTVALKDGSGRPAFRRRVHVWPAPGLTSPLALGAAVRALAADDWKKTDPGRIRQMFAFLLVCEQPGRWKLLEEVSRHLLGQKELDLKDRAELNVARIEALANLGRATQALKLADKILPQFARVPSLKVRVRMAMAAVHQYQLKDAAAASKLYKSILADNRRLEHPNLRLAALRWGDLFAETGDLTRAGETYRRAATLGGDKFLATAQTQASTRGARLRIAEQSLRRGDIHQARRLLEQIELASPEQKLQGTYRFLRAEADRLGGRYEDALRNYEVLLRLRQWAGLRNRALAGIADAYYRMGRMDRAVEWFATLEKAYPDYFKKQKLTAVRRLARARLARARAAQQQGEAEVYFRGFHSGFEPKEPEIEGLLKKNLPTVRALGLQGPHVGMVEAFPGNKEHPGADYVLPIRNLNGGGLYRVEFWYRDTLAPVAHALHNPHVQVWLAGDGLPNANVPNTPAMQLERTYGQWRKVASHLRAPLTQDGKLMIALRGIRGVMAVDALSVRPVSDRENDSLTSYREGRETP